MTRPRRPRWRRLLLGLAASATLTLVLLEVVLRLLPNPIPALRLLENLRGFYQLDAAGRVETAPGFRTTITVDGRPTAVAMNGLGLRGPELPAKAAGERRLLVLGDSFVFGLGVAAEEAIPAQLELRLDPQRSGHVRVGNAGMWGTGPREWAHTLERHLQGFQPDAVLAITYAGNDPKDTLSEPTSVADGWLLDSVHARLYRHSWRMQAMLAVRGWLFLEWFVLLRLWPITGPPPEASPLSGISLHESYFLDFGAQSEPPWLSSVESRLLAPFSAFAAAAPSLPRLVVVLPSREACSPQRWRAGLEAFLAQSGLPPEAAVQFERGAAARRLAALAHRAGLPVVDLTEELFAAPDPDALFLSDYHFNAAGCALVAGFLQPHAQRLLR